MPRVKKNSTAQKAAPSLPWTHDFDHVVVMHPSGAVLLGGQPADAVFVEELKAEAAAFKHANLPRIISSTIESFGIEYALKKISIDDSPDVRSAKLAYVQGMVDMNIRMWKLVADLSSR